MNYNSFQLIKNEFDDLQRNPIASIGVVVGLPNENDYYTWRCTMMGPTDTSFAG